MTEPSVVTIGNFDGVHHGHRHVLARARALAQSLRADPPLPVTAVTFDPHPLEVIAPDHAPLRLSTLHQRIALLRAAGADRVYVLAFTKEMSSWTPDEFVQRVLVDQLKAAGIVIGENFRFGHKAAGDIAFLRDAGEAYGFAVDGLALDGGDVAYSSTLVRSLIAEGEVARAAKILDHPHTLEGVVVKGDQRGRELGFPTANVPADPDVAVPADGVYAGWVIRADGDRLPAAISVGTNPTFDGVERRIESYVLDRTDLDLYGETIGIEFVDRLRGQVKFTGVDDLVATIRDDVDNTRTVLGL
ncbi:MAG: bifunctional riboflavin kinase/FAD synthetase [Kineosporiaceae bacterium]|nr:bifunctional riboflavin kinase/FAD synthetase [Aeromicrobium sp.]